MSSHADGSLPRGVAPGRAQRERQLSELISRVPGARPLNGEASLLEAPAASVEGVAFALRIALPLSFPAEAPELTVSLTVSHPWVDPRTQRVNYESARPWREGASLAALVSDVQQTLRACGRAPAGHAASAAASAGPPSVAGLLRSLSLDGADVCAVRLAALATSELAKLLTDPAAFTTLLAGAAQDSEAAALAQQLRSATRSAAEANLALAQEAAELRQQCAIVRSSDFAPAKARYDAAVLRQQTLRERCSASTLLAQLAAGCAEDEASSDDLERRLVAGELQADAWLKAYKPLRTRMHVRELKRQQAT